MGHDRARDDRSRAPKPDAVGVGAVDAARAALRRAGRRRRRRRPPRRRGRGRAGRHPPLRLHPPRLPRLALGGHRRPRARARRRSPSTRSCCSPATRRSSRPTGCPTASASSPATCRPGDLLPVEDDDPRLVPTYSFGDDPLDADDKAQVREVADELGLGRVRTLSLEGRELAAQRWYDGDGGPDSPARPVGARTLHDLRLPGPARRPAVGDVRRVRQRQRQRRRPGRVASTTAAARTPRCSWPRSTMPLPLPGPRLRHARRSTRSRPSDEPAAGPQLGRLPARRGPCAGGGSTPGRTARARSRPGRSTATSAAGVLEPAVERQQREEGEQPQADADLDGADAVDVERLDVGHDVGAVADLVLSSAGRRGAPRRPR